MRIKMNKAGNGDCFLIQTNTSTVLIDGGTASSYNHWLPSLKDTTTIDALVITHIDNDHVNGIIKLLDDADTIKNIDIKNVFFNGAKQITELNLGNNCEYSPEYDSISSNFNAQDEREVDIGFSEGTSLSYLIESKGLKINRINNGKAIHQNTYKLPLEIGDIEFLFLGPTEKSLKNLQLDWLDILEERGVKRKILTPKHAVALESYVKSLSDLEGLDTDISADMSLDINSLVNNKYIPDNSLANETSFSFIIQNNEKSILMLGDSHVETIIEWMDSNQIEMLHIDAIKVSHHGSKHNINAEFIKRVVCNKYFISTNGKKHHHPDLETLAVISKYSSKPNTNIYINYQIESIPNSFIQSLSDLPNPAIVHFDIEEVTI